MKNLNLAFGVVVLAAALLAPPAVLGSLVAGAAGLLLMASGVANAPVPAPAVRVVRVQDPVRVVQLARGVVVFHQVDGRLVSRFYRGERAAA
jgi:hypothetical protein